MVIIDPNKPIHTLVDFKPESERAKSTDGGFDAIFKQAIGGENSRPASAEPATTVSDVRPARFSTQTEGERTASIIDGAEQLVDTLDAYREKLDEDGATMKDVEPLVQQMRSQSEALAMMSQSEEDADDKLQGMVDQALVLSSMEIARYSSGYYNEG